MNLAREAHVGRQLRLNRKAIAFEIAHRTRFTFEPLTFARLRVNGQPFPRQRTVTRAFRGALRTSSSVTRAPRRPTSPDSRTVGNGLISDGAGFAGGWSGSGYRAEFTPKTDSATSLCPFSTAFRVTTWKPGSVNVWVMERALPNGTPSILQLRLAPRVESELKVAGWPVRRRTEPAGVRWNFATGGSAARAAVAQTPPRARRASRAKGALRATRGERDQ